MPNLSLNLITFKCSYFIVVSQLSQRKSGNNLNVEVANTWRFFLKFVLEVVFFFYTGYDNILVGKCRYRLCQFSVFCHFVSLNVLIYTVAQCCHA